MLVHTPYDGTRKPFSVGLAPLDLRNWFEPDGRLAADLAQRRQLIAQRRDIVVREEPATREGQAEVLALVADHLAAHFPQVYRRDGSRMVVEPAGIAVPLDDADEAPLVSAAQLVQEDLLLMRKGEGGYRLVAGVLCFPSAWSLAEKFGQSLDAIHAAVPGYPQRLATVMNRIFDNLKVAAPVWRLNWSIYPDDELHHPETKERPRDWFDDADELAPSAFVRVERQTLRRMPVSGDILFTVRVHVDPFTAFRRHPEGASLAAGLRDQILGLDAEQLAYKALTRHRDAVAGALDRIARGD
ncbi:MAG TPA: DUF3445 domain-containing protein [Xanthobacteraceae bacterium]|nr:DUF3445 domain-containing protein [Xanthobacteraceae bacterium]